MRRPPEPAGGEIIAATARIGRIDEHSNKYNNTKGLKRIGKRDDGNEDGETRKPRWPYKLFITFCVRKNRFVRNLWAKIAFSARDILGCGVEVERKYGLPKHYAYRINEQ